jgi:hypothetical protein
MQSPPPVKLVVSIGFVAKWSDTDATMSTVAGGWTDVSSRVLSFTMDRGRQDRTAAFEPGHISLVLDGTDRMLDPLYSGSYVYASYAGAPLAPIKVDAIYQGNSVRVFSGYLHGELWRNRRTVGASIEVDLAAVDRMGLFAQLDLPGSPFEATVRLMHPDWWIRGIGGDLFAGNGSPILDSSDGANYSDITATAWSSQAVFQRPSMIAGDSNGAMALTSNVQVGSAATALTYPSTAITAFCMWACTPVASGADQSIMIQQQASTVRWKVVCTNAGSIVATAYDVLGVATVFVAAPGNPSSGGRWDDNQPHSIIVEFTGGSSLIVAVDGLTTYSAAGSTVPATTVGSFIFGSSGNAASVDEVVWWRRALGAQERANLVGAAAGNAYGFGGDGISARIFRWWDLARVPAPDGGEAFYAHHVPDGTDTLLPLFASPPDLASAIRRVIESFSGVAWAQRDGRVRVRTATALTSSAYASAYATPVARISDAVDTTGSPPVVRRSPIQWSGKRADRIINVSTPTWNGATFSTRNTSSVTQYGARIHTWTCDAQNALTPAVLAQSEVSRFAYPLIEMDPVQIDPTVDANVTYFVLFDCELEKAVTVVDTPPTGPAISKLMNIQGEHWRWQNGTDWTVTLNLAPS